MKEEKTEQNQAIPIGTAENPIVLSNNDNDSKEETEMAE